MNRILVNQLVIYSCYSTSGNTNYILGSFSVLKNVPKYESSGLISPDITSKPRIV